MDKMNFGSFDELLQKALSDPELLKGILSSMEEEEATEPNEGKDGFHGAMINKNDNPGDFSDYMIKSTIKEILNVVKKVNNTIETSEELDDLLEEVESAVENVLVVVLNLARNVSKMWYDETEDLEEFEAKMLYRKYAAYKDAGFSEPQAFTLITGKEVKSNSADAIKDLLSKAATAINEKKSK